jgi:hypothetical protein
MEPLVHKTVCIELVDEYEALRAKIDALREMGELARGEDVGSVCVEPSDRDRLRELRRQLRRQCPAYPLPPRR